MAKGKYEQWLDGDSLLRLEAWARDGLTNEQIAHNMGITKETLRVWRGKFPAISAALKRGKEVVDIQVENALLKRALGYKYEETTRERSIDRETGEEKLTVTKVVTKEVIPDVGAQAIWLKNRRPDKWRDRPHELILQQGEDDNLYSAIAEAVDPK